jgi:thioredoxin 1
MNKQEDNNMSVVTLTKDNFEQEVLKSDKPVLVDFWAAWCGPCRMVGPVVEQIAGEHPEYKVGKIDVDDQPELAGQFSIMSIPTLLVFKDGKVHNKTVGVTSKENLLKLFG